MAGKNRTASNPVTLEQSLQEAPYDFEFFQAVRRLECLYADKPRLGQSLKIKDDPIRLAQQPSLKFAPSTLAAYQPGKDDQPPRLSVNFFGLLGPNGPLPLHLTEYAYDRQHNSGDATFARFLDLFHHRMLSLFYRAWANGKPAVNFDRPHSDRFSLYVGAMFGLGMPSLRNRDAVPDFAKLHHAGRMSAQTRNAEGLRAVLHEFFGLPIKISQFVGHWMRLPDDCRCQLGAAGNTGTLGMTATLGSAVWDCQNKFRIVLGPIDFADFQRFLPGKISLTRLVALVRQYSGDELLWDAKLVLKKEQVPPLKLGSGAQLGFSSWLLTDPAQSDADDLVLEPLQPYAA